MVWSVTNNDIVILTVAVYLGSVFSNFFSDFSDDILTPLLRKVIPERAIEDYRYGDIQYGKLLIGVINVVIAVGLALLFAKLARNYGGGVAKHLYR
jgi:large-conductance mechanosensitive channel